MGKAKDKKSGFEALLPRVRRARASFACIFGGGDSGTSVHSEKFLDGFAESLAAVEEDLRKLGADPSSAERLYFVLGEERDSVACIGRLYGRLAPGENCTLLLWKHLSECLKSMANTLSSATDDDKFRFCVRHSQRLVADADSIFADYLSLLGKLSGEEAGAALKRIFVPAEAPMDEICAKFAATDFAEMEIGGIVGKIRELAGQKTMFHEGRAFRFSDGEYVPVGLSPIRPANQFYGYPAARNFFRKYLKSFSDGKENPPLLITSLPGLGKTHFTISFTLSMENVTLVLCEPGDLEKPLEKIIKYLSSRSDRRFVLFFDDVDTRKVNWYYFRTNVGGTFTLPSNISIVIASNYDFPANISSRGRCFTFPLFDEINCMEMVHDYLTALGMKAPSRELISVIAADYVEEFGQRVFEELSPRTLVRYLDRFNADTQKRIKLLNLSKENVVPLPEAACFFETNQKVIQRLNESA